MKIAVFHNFLDNIGGAEIVTLTLARELNADVYTTNINYEKIEKMGFKGLNIFSIGKVPLNAPFRQQIAFWKFRKLNLGKKYDFYIISGDWAMSGVVNNKPNLWYAHSPLNEIWQFRDYVRSILEPWKKPIFDIWVAYNRYLDKKYIKHAQIIVCNSGNTGQRIKRYFNRDAIIINPPIETKNFYYNKNGNFWLSVNRFTPHKRIEIQTSAFKKLPGEKLIIVGSYEKNANPMEKYLNYINEIKPQNVRIISWAQKKELSDLYANCKGFIATAKDEDFGMTPLEAMASGKPVIAPNEGGYKETIINGKTGILIDDINEKKLVSAIKELNKKINSNPLFFKEPCQIQAKNFDVDIFIKKIKKQIKNDI